ncbi:hypothetical protein RIF29_14401 [Crotalaria pallida]|uniref:BAG family molecular chaperone regulator 8, chloroplastic n=1 Tax=Crotalaria pallida TaxID=3830 RepID=A0AAN9IBK7_CROPI
MASHHHPHPHSHHQPPPPSTNCCCCCSNPPSYPFCTPPSPTHPHLLEAIASLLSQHQQHNHLLPPHLYPNKSHTLFAQTHYNNQHQHQQISLLLHRIESLESSLNHRTYHFNRSLRDAAARVIQTHFRSFLVSRSRTLRHLQHLAFLKSAFNALKSSFSNDTDIDFAALSHKAFDLLLQLDSIEGCDPMVKDGKRLISRDLVQFLDSIERVAVKKHLFYVKAAKSVRFGQKVNKSRDSSDDEKRKLLQNLRGRVEKISRLCKVSENIEDSEPEGIHNDDGDHDDGVPSVLIRRRNGVSTNENGVFMQRQGVQPRVQKSVRFAENGKSFEVHSSNAYEPDLTGDVTCLDGSSSSDDQGEVLENVGFTVDDVLDSSQGAEDDEEVLVENGGPRCNSDDGERDSTRDLKSVASNMVKGQRLAHREKLLFSPPLPVKMENKADTKSKGQAQHSLLSSTKQAQHLFYSPPQSKHREVERHKNKHKGKGRVGVGVAVRREEKKRDEARWGQVWWPWEGKRLGGVEKGKEWGGVAVGREGVGWGGVGKGWGEGGKGKATKANAIGNSPLSLVLSLPLSSHLLFPSRPDLYHSGRRLCALTTLRVILRLDRIIDLQCHQFLIEPLQFNGVITRAFVITLLFRRTFAIPVLLHRIRQRRRHSHPSLLQTHQLATSTSEPLTSPSSSISKSEPYKTFSVVGYKTSF